MFTVEAVLSARLSHPNIVQVFEFAEVEGERYLAMEYVHGINVGDLIKQLRDVRVPIGMAAFIVREVSQALAYAHALTDDSGRPLYLIHRDVSPSNVMIGYDGGVKLLDFGVAKALTNSTDERTRTGALKGKVSYMSPEAVEGEVELDGRTDIFAAGVLLFEMLTGRRLFKGHDDLRTISLVRACKIDPPSYERPDVPPDLDRIVLKALAREREFRYQRADELAEDLSKIAYDFEWDVVQTAGFLRLHEVQPGSEPELKALTPGGASRGTPTPALEEPTQGVTVMERRMRSSASLPTVGPHRSRLRWALAGAAGALSIAGGLVYGLRMGDVPGTFAAPTGDQVGNIATPAAPAAPEPTPAAEPPPQPSPAAATETQVATEALPPAPPPAGETPDDPAASAAGAGKRIAAASIAPKNKRRRKPPKQAPAPAASQAPASDRPQIDLKRGDVLKTF